MTELLAKVAAALMNRVGLCATILLLGLPASIWGIQVYAGQNYATKESVEELGEQIKTGFSVLSSRMDLQDADAQVRETESQIRAKEREIADLDAVLSQMEDQQGDAANVLRSRAFTARQDLNEMRDRLVTAKQAQERALLKFRSAR